MYDFLFIDYYFTVFGIIVILLIFSVMISVVYWRLRKQWQREKEFLEKEIESLKKNEFQAYSGYHMAHSLVPLLEGIRSRSEEILTELKQEQTSMREKQSIIIDNANQAIRRVENIQGLATLGDEKPRMLLRMDIEVMKVLRDLERKASNMGIEIVADLPSLEPVLLIRDDTVQAVTNVIDNAIDHSYRDGVVHVKLRLEEEKIIGSPKKRKYVSLVIEDYGEGIKEEFHEGIFKLKRRGKNTTKSGRGLGLYYARELCRRQGGDLILVNSEVNKGSVFKIILPYDSPLPHSIRTNVIFP